MFLVGLRLDLTELYNLRSAATSTALLSIILPFSAGIVLSRELRAFAAPSTPGLPFALFIGVSMSITAFPVLARILSDRGLTQTRLGHLSIACAAFDDVTGWTMLACVTAMIRSDWTAQLGSTATILLIYVAAMLLVGRPLLKWSADHFGRTGDMSLILIIVFLSSWASDYAGIHALFGAFLAGVLCPHAGKFGKNLASVVEPLVITVLLPLFFSYTGIRTNIGPAEPFAVAVDTGDHRGCGSGEDGRRIQRSRSHGVESARERGPGCADEYARPGGTCGAQCRTGPRYLDSRAFHHVRVDGARHYIDDLADSELGFARQRRGTRRFLRGRCGPRAVRRAAGLMRVQMYTVGMMYRRSWILTSLAGVSLLGQNKPTDEEKKLSADELKELLEKKDVFFLDVREPKELEELGTIKGYVNIPLDQLEKRIAEVPRNKLIVTA